MKIERICPYNLRFFLLVQNYSYACETWLKTIPYQQSLAPHLRGAVKKIIQQK
jgi:hypothetical protein